MTLNQFSKVVERVGRLTRDARAIQRAAQTSSVKPLGRRLVRKVVRRKVNGTLGKWGL
jgi:hypothetical protein